MRYVICAVLIGCWLSHHSIAADAQSRFVTTGFQWNLSKDVPGVVEGGYLIWRRGASSRSTNPDIWNVIQSAFDQWSSVQSCALRFKYDGTTTNDLTNYTPGVEIMFSANYAFPIGVIGYTIYGDQRVIILLNDNVDWDQARNPLLLNVALHEIGHAIGLDHTTDPKTVMYPISNGQVTALSDDDKSGVVSLYPDPDHLAPPMPSPPTPITPSPVPIDGLPISACPSSGIAPLVIGITTQPNPGATFLWDYGDGTKGDGLVTPTVTIHRYITPGVYTITLTTITPAGRSESTTTVTVSAGDLKPTVVKRYTLSKRIFKIVALDADFVKGMIAKQLSVNGAISTNWNYVANRGVLTIAVHDAPTSLTGTVDVVFITNTDSYDIKVAAKSGRASDRR